MPNSSFQEPYNKFRKRPWSTKFKEHISSVITWKLTKTSLKSSETIRAREINYTKSFSETNGRFALI